MKKEDNRNRYDDEKPGGVGPLGKALLLILLVWVCWAIYNFTDDRNKAAEDLIEREAPETIEKIVNGKNVNVPIMQNHKIICVTADLVSIEYDVAFKIRNPLTPEELFYYDVRVVRAKIADILERETASRIVMNIYNNKSDFIESLKYKLIKVLDTEQVDLLQITMDFDANFQEFIMQNIERQKIINEIKINTEIAKAKAEYIKKEAIKDKNEHDQKLKQHIIDSMNQVIQYKIDSVVISKLSVIKIPEIKIN